MDLIFEKFCLHIIKTFYIEKYIMFVTPTNPVESKNHLINLSKSLNGSHFWKVQYLSFSTHFQPSS